MLLNFALTIVQKSFAQGLYGNPDLDAEIVVAYEAGWRYRISDTASLDIATFLNDYDGVEDFTYTETPYIMYEPVFHVVGPASVTNSKYGNIHGVETYFYWNPFTEWHMTAGLSYLHSEIKNSVNSAITYDPRTLDPKYHAQLGSRLDLPYDTALDVYAYYVDKLGAHSLPNYVRIDTRFGWMVSHNLEVELIAQNINGKKHAEYSQPGYPIEATKIDRTILGRISWTF